MSSIHNWIMSALGDVRFGGYSPEGVQSQGENILRSQIQSLWVQGYLPRQDKPKQWLVGYRVLMGFSYIWLYPIYVGPKKPSRYRDRYSKIRVNYEI